MSENSVRSIPRQTRSQRTVDLILNSAAALFVEVGYDNATTNAIAERSGVSIGTLYRYFPNKEALLRALTARYHEQASELFKTFFVVDARYLPSDVLLDRLVDPFLEMYCSSPAYAHILLGADASAAIAAVSCELEAELVNQLGALYQSLDAQLDEKRAHLMALVSFAAVKMLISLVLASEDQQYRADVTAEVKRMLLGYLDPDFKKGEVGR